MNKMKKVFKVAIYELKLMCFSSKFLILSVLAFIIMDVTVRGYRMFSHDYNLPIAPAVLPFCRCELRKYRNTVSFALV